MSVDTKLYVEVQDDLSERLSVIKRGIGAVKSKAVFHLDNEVERRGMAHRFQLLMKLTDDSIDPYAHAKWRVRFESSTDDFRFFTTLFGFNGEARMMCSFADCDCDFEDVAGKKTGGVIFSLGCWGSSNEIMREIIKELEGDYTMWYIEDDSKEDLIEVFR